MKSKHTPGPWQIEKLEAFVDGKPRYGLVGPNHAWIGWLNKWEDDPEESAANSRLIAAAPELLDVLKAISTALDAPRNRFGKLEPDLSQINVLGRLAMQYKVAPAEDSVHQAVLVANVVIAKAEGGK